MAKFTATGVLNWLRGDASGQCATEDLEAIRDAAATLAETKRSEQARHRKILEEAARKANIDVEELIRSAAGDQPTRKLREGVRKPFLNPYELQAGDRSKVQIYFLASNRLYDWAEELIKAGWEKDEFRYNRIKKAMQDRGMECKFPDPEELYHTLAEEEEKQERVSRVQKRK